MSLVWTPHAIFPEPTIEDIQALAARSHCAPEIAAELVWKKRQEAIAQEAFDPLRKGWEPPIWRVCHALLGAPWVDAGWAEQMRMHLTFKKPVRTLLIMGGQRGSKSEFAVKYGVRLLREYPDQRAWFLHSTNDMSVQYQQPLVHKYLPPDLRVKDIRTRTTYIKYSKQNGFTEKRFILPNLSDAAFKSYEQGIETIEGGNLNFINPDELVPSDWVKTMEFRTAEKSGVIVITFTPVEGYSETVRMFMDGARTVKESTAFLIPKDGGPPDVARALGLTERELTRLARWMAEPKRYPPVSVWSRPEECGEWLRETTDHGPQTTDGERQKSGVRGQGSGVSREKTEGGKQNAECRMMNEEWGVGTGRSQPGVPAGREFVRLPRVMKPADPSETSAIVFFHSSDNPYGNPLSVWSKLEKADDARRKERFYGFATKTQTVSFPRFDRKAHTVRASDVPKSGTNFHIVDPCSDRNWFMLWVRRTPDAWWVYREWPGNYYVPGEGVPGPWTLPDGKKPDGRPGPGQKSFGWGYAAYKREIARLEGWKEWSEMQNAECRMQNEKPQSEEEAVRGWYEYGDADELIYERYMDARFGNVKGFDSGGMLTLIEDMAEKIELTFVPSSSAAEGNESIRAGVSMINDALYWDPEKPLSFWNRPKLYICEDCTNLIYAMETWTGLDGLKGASKDPIDCLRMAFLKHLEYQPGWEEVRRGRGGPRTTDHRPQTGRGKGVY